MASCNFNINFSVPPAELVQNINTKVTSQGGSFNGNEYGGNFSISLLGSRVSGSYTISGRQLAIVIDHKPFLVSCSQIQNYLQSNL